MLLCVRSAAFVRDGLQRVEMQQLDVFDGQTMPEDTAQQRAFFMDISFDEDEVLTAAT